MNILLIFSEILSLALIIDIFTDLRKFLIFNLKNIQNFNLGNIFIES